jgi:hypothetical protein
MGDRWNAMTQPVSLEEYGEAADRRLRELADQPMDLSGLETAPHIVGTLHSAAPGDSISSIMGSSDPDVIGAFMQANDLNGTSIRAGQSYLVPERDSFTAPGARALGQQGLNTGNALATQQARDQLDRSMRAIGNTISGFDPLKGLLATTPAISPKQSGGGNAGRPFNFEGLGNAFDVAGKAVDGQHLATGGLLAIAAQNAPDLKQAFGLLEKPAKIAGRILAPVEEAARMAGNMRDGVPASAAVPAAALRTGGRLAAAEAGAMAGLRIPFPHPAAKLLAGGVGGVAGGLLGDQLPSGKDIAGELRKVAQDYGRNPFYGMP